MIIISLIECESIHYDSPHKEVDSNIHFSSLILSPNTYQDPKENIFHDRNEQNSSERWEDVVHCINCMLAFCIFSQ
ncbi:unnamed protein product [Moneuplotes crassus]|uniref:Uncharacterized protein n=1 Tax=Euplotes crassus TaxID=5936 RepID=A0AAD1UC71_EUPCR|nr:unnamed protein product [Moneuplotes crassus]